MSEKIRILVCHTDGAVFELPDYEGSAERDDTLAYRLAGHENHIGNLFRYERAQWENSEYRKAILNEIAKQVKPGLGDGFGQSYYDVKSNFEMDAMACWKQHNRTRDCADYKTDAKRLYPDTAADRREVGASAKDRPNTFLCDFCPVKSMVQEKAFKKAGLYK